MAETPWPTHPDGRLKKMGEMTKAEQREQIRLACLKVKRELESPQMRDALQRIDEQLEKDADTK